MTFPKRGPYPAAKRVGIRCAALIKTPWFGMMGRYQGAGGMEIGGTRTELVGSAWTRRGAIRKAARVIAERS